MSSPARHVKRITGVDAIPQTRKLQSSIRAGPCDWGNTSRRQGRSTPRSRAPAAAQAVECCAGNGQQWAAAEGAWDESATGCGMAASVAFGSSVVLAVCKIRQYYKLMGLAICIACKPLITGPHLPSLSGAGYCPCCALRSSACLRCPAASLRQHRRNSSSLGSTFSIRYDNRPLH